MLPAVARDVILLVGWVQLAPKNPEGEEAQQQPERQPCPGTQGGTGTPEKMLWRRSIAAWCPPWPVAASAGAPGAAMRA